MPISRPGQICTKIRPTRVPFLALHNSDLNDEIAGEFFPLNQLKHLARFRSNRSSLDKSRCRLQV